MGQKYSHSEDAGHIVHAGPQTGDWSLQYSTFPHHFLLPPFKRHFFVIYIARPSQHNEILPISFSSILVRYSTS